MIPYFALLIIPAMFLTVDVKIGKSQRRNAWTLTIKKNSQDSVLPIFFFLLLMLLMLRHETIGRDLPNYKIFFRNYTDGGLNYVFSSWQEVLFRLYNWIFIQITDDYQIYLAVTAFITVIPIACVYLQDRSHGFMKIAVFVNMSTFIMLFSGLRQAMAMAVGMLAYCCVKERKLGKFLFLGVVATLIHHSGFMVFFMYPLYHVELRKVHMLAVVPMMVGVYIFNRQIFGGITKLLGSLTDKYEATMTSTGAYGSLVLFALFAIFAHVVTDRNCCDRETKGLMNFLLMTVVIQCFAPLYDTAMRMNYYFILFVPIALGKCITYRKLSMRQVAVVAEAVLSIFFTALFFVNTYRSYQTGISTLDTNPYIPFWKG